MQSLNVSVPTPRKSFERTPETRFTFCDAKPFFQIFDENLGLSHDKAMFKRRTGAHSNEANMPAQDVLAVLQCRQPSWKRLRANPWLGC